MDAAEFWQIVERSRHAAPDKQRAKLRTLLRAKTDPEIAAFAVLLERAVEATHTPALAAAANIVLGGLSDDSYEYFRLWLVAQGKDATLRVLRDPNCLIELIGDDPDAANFEEFAYPATSLLDKRLGEDAAADLIDAVRGEHAAVVVIDKAARRGFAPRTHDLTPLHARIAGDSELQRRRKQAAEEAERLLAEVSIEVSITGLRVGQRVRHDTYGTGVLLSAERWPTVEHGVIRFDDGTTRSMAIAFFDEKGINKTWFTAAE